MIYAKKTDKNNTHYLSLNSLFQPGKPSNISLYRRISVPHDPAEIEAENLSEVIVNKSSNIMQQKPTEQNVIQKKVHNETANTSDTIQPGNNLGDGIPLSKSSRSFFEPRFGVDFSKIKIHTDTGAAEAAEAINAKAFTKGNDIVFAKGQYQPETMEGKKLIAHELVHTLQQKSKVNSLLVQCQQNEQTSITQNGITYYSTREEAEANVPEHVSPRNCFVWNDGPSGYPWHPIPGTGCAHWVAHQLGIAGSPGCYDGMAIRVTQVISGKTQYDLANVQVGDVWTNTGRTHCGIVRQINRNEAGNAIISAQVEHCSSGLGGVVTSNYTNGNFYR